MKTNKSDVQAHCTDDNVQYKILNLCYNNCYDQELWVLFSVSTYLNNNLFIILKKYQWLWHWYLYIIIITSSHD